MEYFSDVYLKLAWTLPLVALAVATSYLLVFKVYADYFKPLRIQSTPYTKKLFVNDAFWSVLNIAGAVFVGVALHHLWMHGFIAFNTASPSIVNLIFEFIAIFFLFDITYYFLHRALHQEPFYSWIHIHHHKTFNPNFFTAFAFHPLEGILAGSIALFWVWILNFHVHTILTILVFQGMMNFSVHFAHEYFPKGWLDKWYTKWFISPTFHDLHHSRVNCNFGGFTSIPDSLMSTLTPDLKKIFDAIKQRKAKHDEEALNFQIPFPETKAADINKQPIKDPKLSAEI